MKNEINGLTKTQRYRLKNLEEYRKRKAAYAKTPEEREKRRLYQQTWRELNREKHNQQAKESHARNKHKHINKVRNYHLLSKYGITLQEKLKMINDQENKCKICNENFKSSRSTHLDHNHKTGEIRGILCHVCNTKLAWYEKHKNEIENYLKINIVCHK